MRTFRVMIKVAVLAALVAAFAPSGATQASPGKTTLDRTIVHQGEEGTKNLGYGPRDARVTRTVRRWPARGRGKPLAGFKHVSDIHVLDEESPGRVEYFDECGTPFTGAYRPQEALTTQVGNSMLKQLAKIHHGPATGVPLDFVVSTGDNVDNNQLNETRWFIRLLDGDRVNPNSGAKSYDGYTREEFSGALGHKDLERAQRPFDSVGAQSPWYAVLGNHDGLVQGNVPSNPVFDDRATGNLKVFVPIEGFESCPSGPGDFGTILSTVERLFATGARPVPADEDRHFLSHQELVAEYFNTTGRPRGHGLEDAPVDPLHGSRAGYYGFPIGNKIRGISLDTISQDGGPNGHIPAPQFRWLRRELKRFSETYYRAGERVRNPDATNKLIMLFSHHSSTTLDNPGVNPEGAPYHCFRRMGPQGCQKAEGLNRLLHRFPNVIAWVNGHEHNNAVRPYPAREGLRNKARDYWEINTAAHIDWPQQSRLIEVAWKAGRTPKHPDTVFVYGTVVDHAADPDLARRRQSRVYYLASLSRREAYFDACVRNGQASCEAPGRPGDRNVKLAQKAPFDLGVSRK
jgi:3',5'-cyclic AMP phosphodiesterase CpdA